MNLKDSFISLDMTLTGDESRELSKKLIELHIPTIHITVITTSNQVIPVGFPKP